MFEYVKLGTEDECIPSVQGWTVHMHDGLVPLEMGLSGPGTQVEAAR